jgi:putative OPT family oligopeptide transporter
MEKKGLPPEAYEQLDGDQYIPYEPAESTMKEFTLRAAILGIVLGLIFACANAYLGLLVGMTVSASIPVAVISMAILRGLFKGGTILENNMVQTIGSAGESLAAGVIFTIPALILLGLNPDLLKIFLISLVGGLLGVLFMIPLRQYLIVREHGKLPYPEGTACAEVLVAGDTGGSKAKSVFQALGLGALYKFCTSPNGGLNLWRESVSAIVPGLKKVQVGLEAIPALLGVGFIVGPKISSYMLLGGGLAWIIIIPIIAYYGRNMLEPLYPASTLISDMDPSQLWSAYIRYIGAGAVVMGGVLSLIKAMPTIISSFKVSFKEISSRKDAKQQVLRTRQDLSMRTIIIGITLIIIVIAVVPTIPVGIIGAILIAIFSFFFVTVSSRVVGLIGSSSNPASGMTIATLLATTIILYAFGYRGEAGMLAAVSIGAVVCVAICVAGDISQDLKTGFLVGGTPRKQQIGEIYGVITSALVMGWVVYMLHQGLGIGSEKLPAPQATLMALVVKGVMTHNLPWVLVWIGVGIALIVELVFKIPALPFAVGLYLPFELSTPIMAGGIIRWMVERKKNESLADRRENGVLFSSGLIAGDALIGVILAGIVAAGTKWEAVKSFLQTVNLGQRWNGTPSWVTLIMFGLLIWMLIRNTSSKPVKSE